MKNVKIFMMFLIVLFLSGCEANYNLYIGNNIFEETTTVTANNQELNTYDSKTYLTMKQKIDLYYMKYVDIVYQDPYYNPYLDDPQSGITYYGKKLINNGDNYGFNYKYSFNKDNYLDSNIVNTFFKNNNSTLSNNKYVLSVNTFNGFERYSDLTSVSISIATDFEVKKNNADGVYGNVYIWNITKDNALDKRIYLELININKGNKEVNNKTILIVLGIACSLIVIGYFSYSILKYKLVKNDSI